MTCFPEQRLGIVIMAAGKGTRMKSDLAKVLHPLNGRAMIHFVLQAALPLNAVEIVIVVGHQRERVVQELQGYPVTFAIQEPQLGTGHAVSCALPHLSNDLTEVLILSGDVPLIKTDTLHDLLEYHLSQKAVATVITANTPEPHGYGRIVRKPDQTLAAITEERDADPNTKKITEINSGIYVFQFPALSEVLQKISSNNDQKEFYLTDAVRLLAAAGHTVAGFEGNFIEVMGVNTIMELVEAAHTLATRELQS